MSELSATNCGCGCGCGCDNNTNVLGGNGGMSSCLWIIILLFLCGGCGGNTWGRSGSDCGGGDGCIWIILLLFFCGGFGSGFGNNGCGC